MVTAPGKKQAVVSRVFAAYHGIDEDPALASGLRHLPVDLPRGRRHDEPAAVQVLRLERTPQQAHPGTVELIGDPWRDHAARDHAGSHAPFRSTAVW